MKFKGEFKDSNGDTIRGVFSIVDDDKRTPIILLVHGFSIDKDISPMPEFEGLLNKKGISTFRMDFFGHGESDGLFEDITISKGVDCVLQAINYLDLQGYEFR